MHLGAAWQAFHCMCGHITLTFAVYNAKGNAVFLWHEDINGALCQTKYSREC